MAIFEEKQPAVPWLVLLLTAVFLLSFPLMQIGMNELYSTEGEYAAAACEFSGPSTLVTVHGTLPASVFPLYPALVRLLLNCGLPLEFSLRFMSLLPLGLLSLLVGLVCGRGVDRQAGAAAATIVLLCSNIVISALETLVETASVGQVPRIRTSTGFSLIKPFEKF